MTDRQTIRLQRLALAALTDRVTIEVCAALARSDVPSVLLKGPAIATWLYDHPSERMYGDVDLLLSPERFAAARAVFEQLGFTSLSVPTSAHEPDYHDEGWIRAPVVVEPHRTLSGATAPAEKVWAALTAELEQVEVDGAPVPALAIAGRCVVVVLHAAHHGTRGGHTLEDLSRAVARAPGPVWQRAAALASEIGATSAFAAGLRLVPEGTALSGRLGLPETMSVRDALHVTSAPPMAHALDWLTSGPLPLTRKAAFVARKGFPPRVFMRSTYPLARRGSVGLGAAYALRLGALAAGLPAAARALREAHRAARPGS